jgi:hypothetical protein
MDLGNVPIPSEEAVWRWGGRGWWWEGEQAGRRRSESEGGGCLGDAFDMEETEYRLEWCRF